MLAGLSDAERASVLGLLQSLLEQHRGLLDYQDE
jgi:hypothetical protein